MRGSISTDSTDSTDSIDHVSDLQWDRLLAGELAAEAAEDAGAHAEACAACSARLQELTAERDAFRLRPRTLLLAPVAAPRRRRWWALSLVPLAAAAAIVIALRVRPRDEGGGLSGERTKGARVQLLLSAGRGGALAPVAGGDVIHAGDSLQAGYTAARDGFGAVLSRDGAGVVSPYVASATGEMVPLPAGAEQSFPQSTVLDDVLGPERVAIVWCEAPRPLAPLVAALSANAELSVPAGCAVREVLLDKRRAAGLGAQ